MHTICFVSVTLAVVFRSSGKFCKIEALGIQTCCCFKGAQSDRVESSSQCFPRELVSFVHPREFICFDP